MKMFELTPEAILTYTKFSVALIMSWPLKKNATKTEIIIFEIKWWILWFHSLTIVGIFIYTAYSDRHNILACTKFLCIAVSCIQYPIKMLICKILRKQMQFVINEMECYIRDAEPYEREMFLYSMKKCGIIHITYFLLGCSAAIGMILGPLILPQSLPVDAHYPFSVDTHPILDIIYVQQIIGGIQCSTITAMDCQIALMFWYIVVRLKILQTQMRKIRNVNEFQICIQKHQYLVWFAKKVINIGQYILLTTIIMTTFALIFGGVHIIGNQPMIVKLQFAIIVMTFCALLFVTAWPSEILIRSWEDVGTAIYESDWTAQNFSKNICFVIQRSSVPVIISIPGLVSTLSLNYYATYLSKALSFFTTLRIILGKIESTI